MRTEWALDVYGLGRHRMYVSMQILGKHTIYTLDRMGCMHGQMWNVPMDQTGVGFM